MHVTVNTHRLNSGVSAQWVRSVSLNVTQSSGIHGEPNVSCTHPTNMKRSTGQLRGRYIRCGLRSTSAWGAVPSSTTEVKARPGCHLVTSHDSTAGQSVGLLSRQNVAPDSPTPAVITTEFALNTLAGVYVRFHRCHTACCIVTLFVTPR